MSGLEIIALIPAIVSAFGTISVGYRDWRKRRDDRRNKSKNVALQKLLAGNGETVQNEYDEDLRLLGPVFQRGDSRGFFLLFILLLRKISNILIIQALDESP
jgi:hypothetical protein